MSDESLTYLERAKLWVNDEQPSAAKLKKAYLAMAEKVSNHPQIAGDDTEACTDYLMESFVEAGGDIDELLVTAAPDTSVATTATDTYSLINDEDAPVVVLDAKSKAAAFNDLKERFNITIPRKN